MSEYRAAANSAKPRKPRSIVPAWLWLSILTVILWGAWGLESKMIVDRISPWMNQVLFPIGFVPITVVMLLRQRAQKRDGPSRGITYALLTGLLGGTGNIALYLALAGGGKASVVVPLTGLGPLVTVGLAYGVLKESLTRLQMVGVAFALISVYLLSI